MHEQDIIQALKSNASIDLWDEKVRAAFVAIAAQSNDAELAKKLRVKTKVIRAKKFAVGLSYCGERERLPRQLMSDEAIGKLYKGLRYD